MPRPIAKAKIDFLNKLSKHSSYAYNKTGKWKIEGTTQAITDWLFKNELAHSFPVDGNQGQYCHHVFITDKGKDLIDILCPEEFE